MHLFYTSRLPEERHWASVIEEIEKIAFKSGITFLHTESSVTGLGFYHKVGYRSTGATKEGTAGKQICIEKYLTGIIKEEVQQDGPPNNPQLV